jgi:ubiquinone biosynthesis protein
MRSILGVLGSAVPFNALELVGGLALGLGLVAVLAVVAGRLLGVRVGAVRLLGAGLIGYAIAGLVSRTLDRPEQPFLLLSVLIGISVLVTMACLVVAEALLPSGSRPRPVRALRRRLARTRRYTQITAIAVRHGLGPYLRGRRAAGAEVPRGRARQAHSLRMALEAGGVTFVKLGQMLSTRDDLLPREVVDELSRLQERVGPAPWQSVRALLEEEFEQFDTVFASFSPEPLAAASVAQVHQARLATGQEVVVKVQRPGIEPLVERDLDIVLRLAETIEARRRRGLSVRATIEVGTRPGLNAVELAHGFAAAIREELDFRVEARNIAAVTAAAERRDADGLVRLPTLHKGLCSRRVLVMQRLDGLPLGAAGAAIDARRVDRHVLARGLLDCLLGQMMLDGVFHADPHPGNVLLLTDGRLGLLDFGSVGRLDALQRNALQQLVAAVEQGDPDRLRDALFELAPPPDEIDEQQLTRAVGQFMARHLAPGVAATAAMFTDLFQLVSDYGLTIPPEVAAVFRALATLEGTLAQLDPGFDIVAEARSFAAAQLGPAAVTRTANEELVAMLPVLRRLPRRVDRITGALEQGRLSVNVRLLADERDRRVITTLLHQFLLAFLGATSGIMGVLLLGAGGGPAVSSSLSLFELLGYNLLVVSLVLVLRVLFIVFRPERPR